MAIEQIRPWLETYGLLRKLSFYEAINERM
jgi:hypothetical protein